MLKKSIFLSFLVVLSLAVIIPSNSVLAKSEISPNTVVTKDNIIQILEYLNIDTSNYDETEVETAVENYPKVTVGELKNTIREMKQIPKEITINESSTNKESFIDENDFSIYGSKGTRTVTRTTNYDSFQLTLRQTGTYWSEVRWDVWLEAGASSAEVTSLSGGEADYKILQESHTATVEKPNHPESLLIQNADLLVAGYLFGKIKISEFDVTARSVWDTSYIY
jgi:hypothetical protein